MIVGNGLISRAFNIYENNDDVIIFASGVSDSSENLESEFSREVDLVKKYVDILDKKFVYFSTCSVSDSSVEFSPYVLHKLKIENYIKENSKNYIIFRLPIVVGHTSNNKTFFNNIKNKIINNETIIVFANATRYLIDVDDLSRMLPYFIDNIDNKTINVCFDNKMSVVDIIDIIKQVLLKNASITIKNFGSNYDIDNSYFKHIILFNNEMPDNQYNLNLIKKYLEKCSI